jgi:hypothetical protein
MNFLRLLLRATGVGNPRFKQGTLRTVRHVHGTCDGDALQLVSVVQHVVQKRGGTPSA